MPFTCHTEKSVVICTQVKLLSSSHRQKCGHLFTERSEVICSHRKLWSPDTQAKECSSAYRQKCGHLLTDNNVVVCLQTKVWSSAHRQKCGYLPQHPVSVLRLDFSNYRFYKVHCCSCKPKLVGLLLVYQVRGRLLASYGPRHAHGTLHPAPCTLHTAPCTLHPAPTLAADGNQVHMSSV